MSAMPEEKAGDLEHQSLMQPAGDVVYKTVKEPLVGWPDMSTSGFVEAAAIIEPGEIISVRRKDRLREKGRIAVTFRGQTLFCDSTQLWASVW